MIDEFFYLKELKAIKCKLLTIYWFAELILFMLIVILGIKVQYLAYESPFHEKIIPQQKIY